MATRNPRAPTPYKIGSVDGFSVFLGAILTAVVLLGLYGVTGSGACPPH